MKYTKPPLTFEEQVDLLSARGLKIEDRSFAISILSRISYYRFSAYCLPFQCEKDKFNDEVNFEDIYVLYKFDHELRMLIFDAFEKIEVAIRTQVTYFMSHRFGAFGYLDKNNFDKSFRFNEWIENVDKEVKRSREIFVKHFRSKYESSEHFPLWMITEIISFGRISFLYSGLRYSDQKKISARYEVAPDVFESWLHMLNYVRNICAHHSRLWNRELAIQPKLPKKDEKWGVPGEINSKRCFVVFSIIKYLLKEMEDTINLTERLSKLFEEYNFVNVKAMGFSENWLEHSIWK